MAVNKKKSLYPLADSDDIAASTRIDILYNPGTGLDNYMIVYGDLSGVAPNKGLLYKIYTDLQATYTDEVISDDDNVYINLGLAATYRKIVITYTAERGSLYRGGTIEVLNDGTNAKANDSYLNSDDDNYDWLICSDSVPLSAQIMIKLTTDDTDANSTTFRYRITEKIEKV